MREIKFRAWAEKITNHVWDYAYPLAKAEAEAKESTEEFDEGELRLKYSKQWKENNPNVDEYTKTNEMITDITVNGDKVVRPYGYEVLAVMQYTGLKDKNGKEIYEGDIVKYPDGTNTIGYEDGSFVRYFIEGGNTSITQKNMSEIEIIGNIYENPELLANKE